MLVTIVGNGVYIRLSRRNLRELNAMLEKPDSRHRYLARRDENGATLFVQAEDDSTHYDGRDRGHGLA